MMNDTPVGIVAGPDGALWLAEQTAGQIVRMTTAGAITSYYSIPTANSNPSALTAGSDGALWFLEQNANRIGRITTTGAITEYTVPTANCYLSAIAAGPDGAVWFTEGSGNNIGRITPAGTITEYSIPAWGAPLGITTGLDGALWFTEDGSKKIGRITTAGTITEYSIISTGLVDPDSITAGPNGTLWFTESYPNKIGRVTTSGVIAEYPVPTSGSTPVGIALGPDGALWFTELLANKIGRITTSGSITEFPVPTTNGMPRSITMGPDGNLWFTEDVGQIGRLVVTAIPQTITFDAIPDQLFGISPFPIAARASSGLPVTIASNTPSVCKTASVLITLLGVGTCSITVSQGGNANYNEATPVIRSFIVSRAKPSDSFAAATGSPLAAGTNPTSVTVGDFNGDGIPDLAVSNYGSENLTVLLGNGSGWFLSAPGSPFAVAGLGQLSSAVGDFNADGIQDLAVADWNGAALLGNGSGGFTPATGSPFAAGAAAWAVAVGDFNGDGIQDLAIANFNAGTDGGNTVTVLLGTGSGGFTPGPGSPFAAGNGATSIAVGDFNGDGIEDLATANFNSHDVTVLLGNGSGGFTPATGSPFSVPSTPNSIAVGDFNGDGIQDLVTANYNNANVSLLLGNGQGGFTPAAGSPFSVGWFPASLVVGDFNGDGNQDLAVANSGSNNVTVLLGNGSGGFTPASASPFAVGNGPQSIAVGDFNGDGILDLATANSNGNDVTVLLGFVMGNTAQTITFGPLSDVTYGALPFAIGATTTSNLAVTFASTTSGVCTLSGTTVTIVGAGQCSITASQAGNATYSPATVTRSFTVAQASQTIAFALLSDQPLSSSPLTISASATSGLGVTFTSTTLGVCTLSGGTVSHAMVTLVSGGICLITASQPGNSNYAAAASVTRTFTVFGVLDVVLSLSFAGTATCQTGFSHQVCSSGGPVTGTYNLDVNRQAIVGPWSFTTPYDVVSSSMTGASAAVDSDTYANGLDVEVGFQIDTATPPVFEYIALVFAAPNNSELGPIYSPVAPYAGSGICQSVPNTQGCEPDVSVAGRTTVVSAALTSFPGGTSSAPADLSTGFPIAEVTSTIAGGTQDFYRFGWAGGVFSATAVITGADASATYVFSEGPAPGCGTSGGVTLSSANTFTATIALANLASGQYCIGLVSNSSNAAAFTLTFNAPVNNSQTIVFDPIPNQILGISPFPIAAQASSGLPVSIVSNTPSVCKIAGVLVTLVSPGTCFITTGQSGNAGYAAAASVTRTFIVSLAKPSFSFTPAAGNPYAAGTGPHSIVVGDFNGDGIPDFAAANENSNNVTVLLGNGSGAFAAATGSPIAAGLYPLSIAVGDFNTDGSQDLAVASPFGMVILLGNGSGGFTTSTGSRPVAGVPDSVAVGDFNGDGVQDLAVANSLTGNDNKTVAVSLGDGSGGFTADPSSPFPVGTGASFTVAGDFNGDGIQDLATANHLDSNVTVLLGNGSGGFAPAPGSPFAVSGFPQSIVLGDFNGDGIQDLATANSGNVTVLLGNGSGGFAAAPGSPFAAGNTPQSIAVGDFNGDGIQDLAVANYGGNSVTVLFGNGSGGFTVAPGSPYAVGSEPYSVAVGDFNGDGILDLVTANSGDNTVSVLLGVGPGHTSQTITFGPLADLIYGAPPFAISATATSNLAVTFASTTMGVCTVSGTMVTIVGAGRCSITASQVGDATYAPAPNVKQSFTVAQAPQSITFGALSDWTLNSSPPALSASASSGLPVTFTSNTLGVCTVSGTTVTLVSAGTCSITAGQPGNATYRAATPVTRTLTVISAAPPVQYLISTYAGALPATPTAAAALSYPLPDPVGIATDMLGNTYVSAQELQCVFKVDPNGVVTRIAGNGTAGYSGDGGAAVKAQLSSPAGLAVDLAGNLYIADSRNYVIREVATSGLITTFAGNGNAGYSGDGAAATSATLAFLNGVALDPAGNLYIADSGNSRVRKVAANGIISTVAGNGNYGYTGDGAAATNAELNWPLAVAVDSVGNIYIADSENNVVRKVSGNGVISTVAGNGQSGYSGDGSAATRAQLNYPSAVAIDLSNNLYIGDGYNWVIRKVANGAISTVAGTGLIGNTGDNGPATAAQLSYPGGVALDPWGNLEIADTYINRIRRVNQAGIITALAGSGLQPSAGDGGQAVLSRFSVYDGVAADATGNLYIVDDALYLRKVTPAGIITTIAGTGACCFSGDGGPATSAAVYPGRVAVDSGGNVYLSGGGRIRKIAIDGTITTVAGTGVDGYSGDNGPATSAQIPDTPPGLAVDALGNLFISDVGNNRVRKVTPRGVISTVVGSSAGFSGDGGPGAAAALRSPHGLAVDARGYLYIADSGNRRIRQLALDGTISTVAGNGNYGNSGDGGPATSAQLDGLTGIAVDSAGNLFIMSGTTIRKVSGGIISTIAGTGTVGYAGDGGLALSAQLNQPVGVAADAFGNIYFSGSASNLVRVLQPTGTAPLLTISHAHSGNFTFGQTAAAYTLTVTNAALALPTSSTVTVTEILPAGLTLVSMSGDNWHCSANVCTNTDPLAAGASYPITVTVDVAADAPPQVTAKVGVTGGGSIAAAAEDVTNIGSATPVLEIASSHAGNFAQGQTNATYTLTVGNQTAAAATTSPVTVTETLPTGLTLVSMSGAGWNCGTNTCSRNEMLQGGASFPPISVVVTVASDAPFSVVNDARASGGGAPDAGALDVTSITYSPCDLRQNGNPDVANVQSIVNQVLGVNRAVNDLNGDGVVNVVDLQVEVGAAGGLGCSVK